jgi:predicted ABC-type sugar transport system permease subunit
VHNQYYFIYYYFLCTFTLSSRLAGLHNRLFADAKALTAACERNVSAVQEAANTAVLLGGSSGRGGVGGGGGKTTTAAAVAVQKQ